MRYLITGGCGFIGSAFIRRICSDKKNKIINIDKLTYAGNTNNIPKIDKSVYLHKKFDFSNKNKLNYELKNYKPNIIINFAAESHVDRSIDDASNFIRSNIIGTYNLLEYAKNVYSKYNSIDKKKFKFIQISTDEVYGDIPTGKKSTEKDQYRPNSPYSASKSAADQLVRAWHKTYSLPTITTHCCNNFGPFQLPEKLIPLMILNAIEHRNLPIYGNGKQVREWIFVEENISMILKLINQGKIGEHYNISSGTALSNIKLVNIICNKLDKIYPSKKINSYSQLIRHVQDRPAHDKRYAINASKFIRKTNYKYEYNFEKALEETILWYIQNINWFKKNKQSKKLRKRVGIYEG